MEDALALFMTMSSSAMALALANRRTRTKPRARAQHRGGGLADEPDEEADTHVRELVQVSGANSEDNNTNIAHAIQTLAKVAPEERTRMARAYASKVHFNISETDSADGPWCAFHRQRLREIAVHAPDTNALVRVKRFDWGEYMASTLGDADIASVTDRLCTNYTHQAGPTIAQCRQRVAAAFNQLLTDGQDCFVLAGGFLAQVANNRVPQNSSSAADIADMDLCVYKGKSLAEARRLLHKWLTHTFFQAFCPSINGWDMMRFRNFFTWYGVNGACELYLNVGMRVPCLQLNACSASARSVGDVLLGFDRAACAYALDPTSSRVVALERAVAAHTTKSEPADLVFGSGGSRTSARTALRDTKYNVRFGIEVVCPPWINALLQALRDAFAFELLRDLADCDTALMQYANGGRLRVTKASYARAQYSHEHPSSAPWISVTPPTPRDKVKYNALQAFSRRFMALMAMAPPGLVTTLVVRFVVREYMDLLMCTKPYVSGYKADETVPVNKEFHKYLPEHKVAPSQFVSRRFSRACHAVRDIPPFAGQVLSDVCEWMELAPALASEVRALPDAGGASAPSF